MGMLNITSLPKHIDEIRILLTDQCLDVLALNETRLDDNISNEDIHIDSYDLIRFDRSRKGGGVEASRQVSLRFINCLVHLLMSKQYIDLQVLRLTHLLQ